MKTFRKSILAAAISLSMLVSSSGLFAQTAPEPAVVVSIANIKEQLNDVNYLMDKAGYGQMAFLVKVQVEQFLKGVDTNKPSGIMLFFGEDKDEPDSLAFLPMSNLDDFLTTISEYADVDETDEMTTIIPDNGEEIFLKEANGFAFVTNDKAMFDVMPSDPEKTLGDLANKYNVAARIFGQRIPDDLRNQAMDMLEEQFQNQIDMIESADPLQADIQRENLETRMELIKDMIKDTETIEVGFAADKESGNLKIELALQAVDGSKFGAACTSASEVGPSRFAGMNKEGAAFTAITRMKLTKEEAAQYENSMSQMKETLLQNIEDESDLTEAQVERAGKIIDKLNEVIVETMESGELDSGAVGMMDEGKMNFAGGFHVENPAKAESAVKDLVELAKEIEDLDGMFEAKLNSGTHAGVQLHTIHINVPEDEEELSGTFGDKVALMIGVGKKELYAAVGTSPESLLKEAIDASQKPAQKVEHQVEYNIYLTPIMRFAAGIESNEAIEIMADKLAEADADNLTMTYDAVKNGITGKLIIADGILGLIGAAGEAFGQGGFPGGDDF